MVRQWAIQQGLGFVITENEMSTNQPKPKEGKTLTKKLEEEFNLPAIEDSKDEVKAELTMATRRNTTGYSYSRQN